MTFSTLPDERAVSRPSDIALVGNGAEIDNSGFKARVVGAAHRLRELGVGAGDVVAVQLPNGPDLVVIMFAAWRLGAALTPINPVFTEHEVARQLDDSAAKVLVVATDEAAAARPDAVASHELDRSGDIDITPFDDPSAVALLIYTSGTTGAPKGVMLDHANICAMVEMAREALSITAADRCLLVLPLFHVNGIIISVLTPLLAGGRVVITQRFDPSTFFDLIETHHATFFSAVPTIYGILAALPAEKRPDTSSVRLAVCGAAPAPPELLDPFESRYGVPVVEGYGLSEATCGSTMNPVAGPRKPGTAGIALPGQEIRIADSDGAALPVGSVGEITVRGPNVMRGYLGRPDATAAVLDADGWLHTGDLGVLDSDGYLTVVGRTKDMIIRGGENIYPKEIEDVLTGHPAVDDAAVIGAPDPKWGEVVVAFVAPRPGVTIGIDSLDAVCATQLSPFKRPVDIVVVDVLPTNAVGKIDKVALRQRYGTMER